MSNSGTATAWNIPLLINNLRLTGGGSATLSNGGAGQSLVSSTSAPPALATKSLTAGSGITLTPTGTNITISASGAAGPYLPLAGGTMDPLPVGIITAHTIDGIESLTGINSVAPFIIQTASSGDNILIDSTPSNGNVDINAFSTTITTDPTATVGIEMNGAVVITPPAGYTYPESIPLSLANVGALIKDWYNTNVAGNINQAGLALNVIKSDTGQTFGIIINDINAISSDAYAILCGTVNGQNSAYGASFSNITSAGNATGFSAANVTGSSAVGLSVSAITSTTGNSDGIIVGSIQGETDCQGLQIASVTSNVGNGHGVLMDTISSTTGNAFGIRMNSLQSSAESYGFFITNVLSTAGLCWGGKIDNVRSDTTDSVGLEIKRVGDNASAGKSATSLYLLETLGGTGGTDEAKAILIEQIGCGGTSYGVYAINISATSGAFFTYVDNVVAQNVVGHFLGTLVGSNSCKGFEVNGATSLLTTVGLALSTLTSNLTTYGILGQTIQAVQDCYGSYLTTLGSTSGNCTGYSVESITARGVAYGFFTDAIISSTTEAYGSYINDVTGTTNAFGSLIQNVIGVTTKGQLISGLDSTTGQCIGVQCQTLNSSAGSSYGMVLSSITGRTPTYGTFITSINSAFSTTTGSLIENVTSTANKSTGIEVYRVTALTDATGILVSDIQSSGGGDVYGIRVEGLSTPLGRSYGCYLTTNNTSADQFGFYQNGTLNQGNVLEAQTTIGAQSGTNTALVVNGCMKTSVQRTAVTPFAINKNTGNTVISTVVGASSLVLPAVTSIEDGLTFSIFHRGTGTITLSGSGGQTINGAATFAFPGASGHTYMTVWWDFVAADWFAHVN